MKTCPLRTAQKDDILVLRDVDPPNGDASALIEAINRGEAKAVMVKTGKEQPAIFYAHGICEGERCGWWSIAGECCGIARIANIIRG